MCDQGAEKYIAGRVSFSGREVGRDEEREAETDLLSLVEEFGFCPQGM